MSERVYFITHASTGILKKIMFFEGSAIPLGSDDLILWHMKFLQHSC